MKKVIVAAVAAITTIAMTSCNSSKPEAEAHEPYAIKTFADQPFLGETYIEDYDFEAANDMLLKRYAPTDAGACSSFRSGQFQGRNLDWFLKDYAILIVHIPADSAKHRYASVNAISSNPFISRETIASGIVSDTVKVGNATMTNWRKLFPVFTTDGVNECGLCVNQNIVLHEDGAREGYIPCTGKEGKKKIAFPAIGRYILDNCSSCDDAIKKLSELSPVQAYKGPLASEDSHYMVSDSTKTIVFEWRNNEMVYTIYNKDAKSNAYYSANGMPAVMTNFFNCVMDKNTKEGVTEWEDFFRENPYAMGVERYINLVDSISAAGESLEACEKQIEKVLYSQFYDYDKSWLTENAGYYHDTANGAAEYASDGTKTKWLPADSYYEAMLKFYTSDYTKKEFDDYGSLDKQMKLLDQGKESDKWYTELTSIFDIKNKCMYIMPQEGWYKHEYTKFTIE